MDEDDEDEVAHEQEWAQVDLVEDETETMTPTDDDPLEQAMLETIKELKGE